MRDGKIQKITPMLQETYLTMLQKSVGSKMFQTAYVTVRGKKRDVLKNGELSCAFFVSSVLRLFGLIKEVHVTVSGTVSDMEKSGWKEIQKPRKGSVLIWEPVSEKGEFHGHIGFFLGKSMAVSNSTKNKKIAEHHYTFGREKSRPKRKIRRILHHPKLDLK
ncbi:MAG TPA: hypothetical protein VFM02_04700 [Candidatus Paceibacterota bacterium]|nr:hypothetical protein [Candidatus Paceibacterota bacterium]